MRAKSPQDKIRRRTNHIDHAFGEMVRNRRILAGLSQAALGEALGLTFQQVQKYELGSNRVSVNRLFALGNALGSSPSALLHDLEGELGLNPTSSPADEAASPAQKDALVLIHNYVSIENPRVRKQIFDLTCTIAVEASGDDESKGRSRSGERRRTCSRSQARSVSPLTKGRRRSMAG